MPEYTIEADCEAVRVFRVKARSPKQALDIMLEDGGTFYEINWWFEDFRGHFKVTDNKTGKSQSYFR